MPKTVLITGASRGIGRAMAQKFASEGFRVALGYLHSEEQALALEAELKAGGCETWSCRADVTKKHEVDDMVSRCEKRLGPVEVLVNNAGIAQFRLFSDITAQDWDAMMSVHLKGMFHCCQAVLPGMLRRKEGRIINISSIWGMTGASCEVHYSTAKAGVIGFTKALAKEVGPSGIRVNCIAPGVIETDMLSALGEKDKDALRAETPLLRLGAPEDIAAAALFLAGAGGDFITGQVLSPNGGFVI